MLINSMPNCVAGLQALLSWPLLTKFACGRLFADGAALSLRSSTHDVNAAIVLPVHAQTS